MQFTVFASDSVSQWSVSNRKKNKTDVTPSGLEKSNLLPHVGKKKLSATKSYRSQTASYAPGLCGCCTIVVNAVLNSHKKSKILGRLSCSFYGELAA